MELLPRVSEPLRDKVRPILIQKVLSHLNKKRPIDVDRTSFMMQASRLIMTHATWRRLLPWVAVPGTSAGCIREPGDLGGGQQSDGAQGGRHQSGSCRLSVGSTAVINSPAAAWRMPATPCAISWLPRTMPWQAGRQATAPCHRMSRTAAPVPAPCRRRRLLTLWWWALWRSQVCARLMEGGGEGRAGGSVVGFGAVGVMPVPPVPGCCM
jgi:hypothetical protein